MNGSALSHAVIGSEDLATSIGFWRDMMGLDVQGPVDWWGFEMSNYFGVDPDTVANVALASFPGSKVGRVLLVEFTGTSRKLARAPGVKRFAGLWNLNSYTADIHGATDRLRGLGYEFWSDPVTHELSAATGSPTEVVFEGPDGVPINLVELPYLSGTRVGEMRAYFDAHGTTATGFTEVVTTAHVVKDRQAALEFHTDVLGMEIIIDEEMASADSARFLGLESDARSHITFVKGDHMFGKVVLNQPINYEVVDVVADAVPPNVGYLMMSFELEDIGAALLRGTDLDVVTRNTVSVPLLGAIDSVVVRCPGSGALIEMFTPIDE